MHRAFLLTGTGRAVLALLLVVTAASKCSDPSTDGENRPPPTVRMGAEVLVRGGLERLAGTRVGLIVNQTSRVDTAHLVDVIDRAEDVELAALFAPEHGLEGRADAGAEIEGGRDSRTGTPLYSLYGGERRAPPAEVVRSLDVLIFDVQDVGARCYTYVSTMGRAMQVAAQEGTAFLVLDRPNPLGGTRVGGFVLEPEHRSFVGLYPIPMRHGLTVGELARMLRGEGWLDGVEELRLDVVPVEGWTRSEPWMASNRPWTPPSPNIPTPETAMVYPGTVFFEATAASEGRGTTHPFQLVGTPWADGSELAATMQNRGLPGVRFEAARFTPESRPGASDPKLDGTLLEGVRLRVTDPDVYRPVATGIHLLHAFYHRAPSPSGFLARPEWLTKLAGTERLLAMLRDGARPETIVAAWEGEVQRFRDLRAPYLLY
jgi:uncharacterized protein YbbC (DUF1343 family)